MRNLIVAALTLTTLAVPAVTVAQSLEQRLERRDERLDDRRDDLRDDRRDFREDRRDYRDDRRDDRRDFRDDRRADRYQAGRYYGPRGYAYRNWAVGSIFPNAYYDRRYWIGNYAQYRLPSPYRGARWVRYGPDAVLIRVRDGSVIRVIRNRFY